jgi:demethylspheroidene O-methyltransferase
MAFSDPPLTVPNGTPPPSKANGRLARLVASPAFQRWAARTPVVRRFARRDGEALFDLLAGFCHTQALTALIELDVLTCLAGGPATIDDVSRRCRVPPDRMRVLLRAGDAIGLLRRSRGRYRLSTRGAALSGVPGLAGMIRHNAILYRDLADPAAFFRGETQTEMAGFWPYVFGAGAAADPETAERYSQVMAESQTLVADEVLSAVSLSGARHLMDVGGGIGVFLDAVGAAYPDLKRTLFDLPPVISAARRRFSAIDVTLIAGSFRDDPLPEGADAISLVRILFDHSDATVRALLARVYAALPAGGRVIVAEPMGRDAQAARPADAYFALYTLAMGTGRTRTVEEVSALLAEAGFERITAPRVRRAFVTRVVAGQKSS